MPLSYGWRPSRPAPPPTMSKTRVGTRRESRSRILPPQSPRIRALASAGEEAIRADLLIEDGEWLRFRHDLLREATRQSLPQSLRRAMERQSATVMLDMGAAPEEVATQLARCAEVGDQAAITALRQAAQSVANSDP